MSQFHKTYRPLTTLDIVRIPNVTDKERAVLHAISALDSISKKNKRDGCFATAAHIADKINSTAGSVRVLISRLRKKGFIADLGYISNGSAMLHRVVVPTDVWEEMESVRKNREEQRKIRQSKRVHSVHNPVNVKFTRRMIDVKEEDKNPPAADSCLSDSCYDRVVSVEMPTTCLNPKTDTPVALEEPVKVQKSETPVKKSHKKRDWSAALSALVFFPLLQKTFACVDEYEAQRLVRLVESKKISAPAIGYALSVVRSLPKERTEHNVGTPLRPSTVSAFVDRVRSILEYAVKAIGEDVAEDIRFELTNYQKDKTIELIGMARSQVAGANIPDNFDAWVKRQAEDPFDRDIYLGEFLYHIRRFDNPHTLLMRMTKKQMTSILNEVVCDPFGAKTWLDAIGYTFETVFKIPFEYIVATHNETRAKLEQKMVAVRNPELWTPETFA